MRLRSGATCPILPRGRPADLSDIYHQKIRPEMTVRKKAIYCSLRLRFDPAPATAAFEHPDPEYRMEMWLPSSRDRGRMPDLARSLRASVTTRPKLDRHLWFRLRPNIVLARSSTYSGGRRRMVSVGRTRSLPSKRRRRSLKFDAQVAAKGRICRRYRFSRCRAAP